MWVGMLAAGSVACAIAGAFFLRSATVRCFHATSALLKNVYQPTESVDVTEAAPPTYGDERYYAHVIWVSHDAPRSLESRVGRYLPPASAGGVGQWDHRQPSRAGEEDDEAFWGRWKQREGEVITVFRRRRDGAAVMDPPGGWVWRAAAGWVLVGVAVTAGAVATTLGVRDVRTATAADLTAVLPMWAPQAGRRRPRGREAADPRWAADDWIADLWMPLHVERQSALGVAPSPPPPIGGGSGAGGGRRRRRQQPSLGMSPSAISGVMTAGTLSLCTFAATDAAIDWSCAICLDELPDGMCAEDGPCGGGGGSDPTAVAAPTALPRSVSRPLAAVRSWMSNSARCGGGGGGGADAADEAFAKKDAHAPAATTGCFDTLGGGGGGVRPLPRRLVRLPCDHVFHGRCLRRWLRLGGSTCPLCKRPVTGGGSEGAAPDATEVPGE